MNKIVGIDLGTTNSVIAVMEGASPVVVPNSEGFRTTPSIVAYTKKGDLLVGQIAKRQAVINAENTFYSVKRFIGSNPNEVADSLKKVSYPLVEEGDLFKVKCSNLNTIFSPEEISAQVLRVLVSDVSNYLGQTVTKAVVTVPAYFNDNQRQATKDAGKIAGLEILRIINEPTAASLAYGLDKRDNERILVFDLGGGTFDVSILEVGDGIFEVLATSGDTKLGGDVFDQKLVNYLLDEFEKKEDIDLKKDPQALQRLTEAAEKAKIELSTLSEVKVSLPFITLSQGAPKHIDSTISRSFFEELCETSISSCRVPVEQALNDARLERDQIDQVVLVGGSTRIPSIQNLVKSIIGKLPNQTVNPDEVVAIGAAIQGGVIAGEVKDILLLDVTPLSLGVETMGGVMTKMINRNTTIPTRKSEVFSTAVDNQTNVDINVLQGEREFAIDNKSLGRFRLEGIPLAPRGVPQVEVSFDIDVNGILIVTAKDQQTKQQQSITIQGSSTLDEKEIERMVSNAEAFAKADKEKRELVDLKNTADTLIYQTQKQLDESSSNIDESQKNKVQTALDSLKNELGNENPNALKSKIQELQVELTNLSSKVTDSTDNTSPNPNEQ